MNEPVRPWMPPGTDAIGMFARSRGMLFDPRPDERWFRHWEPHDTMVAPELWLNAVTERARRGTFVVAEPWTANEGFVPIERTVVGFAQIQGPQCRAAMRVGEPFLTRVAFLESAPPAQVELGDPTWDEHVTTFANAVDVARRAFPPALRELLRARGFRGHLEIRSGGFVVHHEGSLPTPHDYDLTLRMAHDIARALQSGHS